MGYTPKHSASQDWSAWLRHRWAKMTKSGNVKSKGYKSSLMMVALSMGVVVTLMILAAYRVASSSSSSSAGLRIGSFSMLPSRESSAPVAYPYPYLQGTIAQVPPHGPPKAQGDGSTPQLVQLLVGPKRRAEILSEIAQGILGAPPPPSSPGGSAASGSPPPGTTSTGAVGGSWTLTPRQTCDLELLLTGGFSPLIGFMDRHQYASVLSPAMRLGQGLGLGLAYAAEEGAKAAREHSSEDSSDLHESAGAYHAPGATAMRLPSAGSLWPMPITLDLPLTPLVLHQLTTVEGRRLETSTGELSQPVQGLRTVAGPAGVPVPSSSRLLLRDAYHNALSVLTVTDMWVPDVSAEAQAVFGTTDETHPGVHHLLQGTHPVYVGGVLEGLSLPAHYDFTHLRRTPAQVRAEISRRKWARTVAFQTRNPMHRAHIELTRLAGESAAAGVLLHPVVGMTKPGDIEYSVRVRCYEAVASRVLPPGQVVSRSGTGEDGYYASGGVLLSLLPLAMRMGGPREALWHAIIRKNHGASHFIVGRDHAGVKSGKTGKDFYGPYDAQKLVLTHAEELGLSIIPFHEVEYVPSLGRYLPSDQVPAGQTTLSISGTKFRAMMAQGQDIPPWFSDPAVISILRALQPPTRQRGFVVFFTGLSGGGKTTLSHALIQRLQALVPTRRITQLDGDVVRTHLSRGLGFSISDRNANVERIGFVAAEAARHGGIVIAAPIAPFEASREAVRRMVTEAGAGFVLVHVASSVAQCAVRDVKGLYGASGYGRVSHGVTEGEGEWRVHLASISNDLTGISHPYEHPLPLPVDALHAPLSYSSTAAGGGGAGAGAEAAKGKGPQHDPGSLHGVDVHIDTSGSSPEGGASVAEGAAAVVSRLMHLGYIDQDEMTGLAGAPAQEDDDGTGRRRSRLTEIELALVEAMRSLPSLPRIPPHRAYPDHVATMGDTEGGEFEGTWAEQATASQEGMVHAFPTLVAEQLGKSAAAALLRRSERDVCGYGGWDAFAVPAAHASNGSRLSPHDLSAASTDGLDMAPLVLGEGSEGSSSTVLVRLHAGLPSRGSPAARSLQQRLGQGTPLPAHTRPAQLHLILLPSTVPTAPPSSYPKPSPSSPLVLSPARVHASLAWALRSEGGPGAGAGGGSMAGASQEEVPPMFLRGEESSLESVLRAAATSAGRGADQGEGAEGRGEGQQGQGHLGESASSSLHASSKLPESVKTAAAYDLWTGLRWDAALVGSSRSVLVPPQVAALLHQLLPAMLRLDPCLHATLIRAAEEGLVEQEPAARGRVVEQGLEQYLQLQHSKHRAALDMAMQGILKHTK